MAKITTIILLFICIFLNVAVLSAVPISEIGKIPLDNYFADFEKQHRGLYCLNGEWEFQPQPVEYHKPEPMQPDMVKIRVPSGWNVNTFAQGGADFKCFPAYPQQWEKALRGWYRRYIQIPQEWTGKKYILRFEAVSYFSEVFIDNIKIGEHDGGLTPFEIDITDNLSIGKKHELLVGVRSWQDFTVTGLRPFPIGSFWGEHILGIWQDVYLKVLPSVNVQNVFIKTSVRNSKLDAALKISNKENSMVNLTMICEVIAKDSPIDAKGVKVFEKTFPISAKEEKSVEMSYSWMDPKLWSPEEPNLYELRITLQSAGKILDRKAEVFGFREFWTENGRFYFNGKPIKLRADAWHYLGMPAQTPEYAELWFSLAKETGLNAIRLHAQPYPSFYLDIADRMGMLIIDETGFWASAQSYLYNNDFWKRAKQQIKTLTIRDRNHPSVIMWSVANEVIQGHQVHPKDGFDKLDDLLHKVGELVDYIRELDPTRPINSDGDKDLAGKCDVYSLHYPGSGGERTISNSKPISIGESGSMFFSTPEDLEEISGDKVYKSFNARLSAIGKDELYELLHNYRKWADLICPFNLVWYSLEPFKFSGRRIVYERLDTPGIKPDRWGEYCSTLNPDYDSSISEKYIPNPVYKWLKRALLPKKVFIELPSTRYFAGENISGNLFLCNDTTEDATFEIQCRLVHSDMSSNDSAETQLGEYAKNISLNVKAGDNAYSPITITLPVITEKTKFDVIVKTQFDVEKQEIAIYPKESTSINNNNILKIYLIDKSKKLRSALESISNLELVDIPDIESQSSYDNVSVLLINTDEDISAAASEIIQTKISSGMNLLCFLSKGNLFPAWEMSSGKFKRAFIASKNEQIFNGLSNSDLIDWNPDGILGEKAFRGVLYGNVKPLVVCKNGLYCLIQASLNKGTAVISTMNILESMDKDPSAQKLFNKIIQYILKMGSVRQDKFDVALCSNPNSRLYSFLSTLGLKNELIPGEVTPGRIEKHQIIILNGGEQCPLTKNAIQFASEKGKTILIWGLEQPFLDTYRPLLPQDFSLAKTDIEHLAISKPSAITDGILNSDLYWITQKQSNPIIDYSITTTAGNCLAEIPNVKWRLWNWQPEMMKVPAIWRSEKDNPSQQCGILEYNNNGARVIIYQIRPEIYNVKSLRTASILLNNIGTELGIGGSMLGRSSSIKNVDERGFIRTWLVVGPFDISKKDDIEKQSAVVPEEGNLLIDKRWKAVCSDQYALDLQAKDVFSAFQNSFCYAGIYIYSPISYKVLLNSPEATGVTLNLGSDDSSTVWLNGEKIIDNSATRPFKADDDKITGLRLEQGWNLLLIKVHQYGGSCFLCARLLDNQKNPIEGLQFSTCKPSILANSIPDNALLSTTVDLLPIVSGKQANTFFPRTEGAEFVFIPKKSYSEDIETTKFLQSVYSLLSGKDFGVIGIESSYLLLRKGYGTALNRTASSYFLSRIYQEQDLNYKTNRAVQMEGASNGLAVHSSIADDDYSYVIWGPYHRLPKGKYRVEYFIKTDNNELDKVILQLNVSTKEGEVLGARNIRGIDFSNNFAFLPFSLPIDAQTDSQLEFRILFVDAGNFWFDKLEVSPDF